MIKKGELRSRNAAAGRLLWAALGLLPAAPGLAAAAEPMRFAGLPRAEPMSQAAAAIYVLTGEQIHRSGARTHHDEFGLNNAARLDAARGIYAQVDWTWE